MTARDLINDFIKLNLQVTEKAGDYSPAMVKLYRIELKSYRKLERLLSDE